MENEKVGSKTDGKNDNEPRKDTDEDKEQGQSKKTGEEETRKEKGSERYSVELTVEVVVDEGSAVTMMDLLKGIQKKCGVVDGCRVRGERLYEVTMRTCLGKMKIMEGLRVNGVMVHAQDLLNNDLTVSFLNLPVYVPDRMILKRLEEWGVEPISAIKKRVWPGTEITDGTRFLRVRFNDKVRSLPYSTKLDTVRGAEYFRVLHNRQVPVCRLCIQPDVKLCQGVQVWGGEREEEEEEADKEEDEDKEEDGEKDEEGAEGVKKRPFEDVSDEDEGPSDGGAVGGEEGAKRSAKQSSGGTEGSSRGAEGSSGGGKKCRSPGVVEDISEASEMEEGELEEGPVDTKVFGSPNDEPRGRGMRRNRSEEKKTSSENAGRAARRKADKERVTEKRRVSSTEGELGKDTGNTLGWGCVDEVKKEWMGEVFANNGSVHARGVAILINSGVVKNARMVEDDGEGRMIGVQYEYMGEMFKLINVYAPNGQKERKVFFEGLDGKCGGNCMIVGDFNSRIDLALSSEAVAKKIGRIEYRATALSDHMVLSLRMGLRMNGRGGGVWCLNAKLLNDEVYKGKVRECIREGGGTKSNNILTWWGELKDEIKKISIKYSKGKNMLDRRREKRVKGELLRRLKLRGKVTVINGLIGSKLVYIMNVMEMPERVHKEIDTAINAFLWSGRGARIVREVMENEHKDGGMKLINLERRKKALRVKMILRYISDKEGKKDHAWKIFLKEAIKKCGGCGDSALFMALKKEMLSGVSEYHREALLAWGEFLKGVKHVCVNVEQVWNQPVFLNHMVAVEQSPVFDLPMWKVGFRHIRDLVYEFVPGFMGAQVIVDEVRGGGGSMLLRTAEGIMNRVKKGMPGGWREMIESEAVRGGESVAEMYVGEGDACVKIEKVKTKTIYKMLRGNKVRRPTSEGVWEKVLEKFDGRKIWGNLRVKWNSIEVYNNLIVSKFDVTVKRECDVCKVKDETCMHEFFECSKLKVFFERLKELIDKCWGDRIIKTMVWKELWLFGVNERMKGLNVNLCNYVLSHARYAVKIRRDVAHLERRTVEVWDVLKRILSKNIQMAYAYLDKDIFLESFVEGCALVDVNDNGNLVYAYDGWGAKRTERTTTNHGRIPRDKEQGQSKKTGEEETRKEKGSERYSVELTVEVVVDEGSAVTMMDLLKGIQKKCGVVDGCRVRGERLYEVTMRTCLGKMKIMEGLRVNGVMVHAQDLLNNDLTVSFLNLPVYVPDRMILKRLEEWGVEPISAIKKRVWPGTEITDGTRFLRVRFNDKVRSLPYSTKLDTVRGAEYFRVLHNRQVPVCRLCIQPGHIFRECPEFKCFKCGQTGHYARECRFGAEREEEEEEEADKEEDEDEEEDGEKDEEGVEGARKRPFEDVSDEDEGPSDGGAVGAEAPRGVVEAHEGSSGGGKKCRSPGVVEDISEASEMEEGELEEGPVDTKVFGSPNDEPRGRCMRRNRSEEKKTSSENAGRTARCKADNKRETEKRRVSSTEGELGEDTGLSKIRRERALILCEASIICLQETHWDGGCVDEVKKEWMGEVFANNGSVQW
ncbi:hypothetical protein F7725_012134 [Dissostichus mawsoni]|uniref:CCHC-type domain-containing protein n=1 Tax=Dissostichus mawsoni TaxID=36200 RepID=A0A7J5ZBI6_DISMA|nr:hypothetical protein F7725_012134 [Dissostichus mawsoni]